MERERVWARRQPKTGVASNYISRFNLRPGDIVALWCRVSTPWQQRRGHLADQEATLRRAVAAAGAHVAVVVPWEGSGADSTSLAYAAAEAQRHGATVLLAESTDRFVRSARYSACCQNWLPLDGDFEYLRYMTDGFPLMTLIDPDATPGQMRAYQTRRGQTETGRKGGRPAVVRPGDKRRRRENELPKVLEKVTDGGSLRQISREIGIPISTLQEWLQKYD